MTRINRNGVSFESGTLSLRDSYAKAEMYALIKRSGACQGITPAGGQRGARRPAGDSTTRLLIVRLRLAAPQAFMGWNFYSGVVRPPANLRAPRCPPAGAPVGCR